MTTWWRCDTPLSGTSYPAHAPCMAFTLAKKVHDEQVVEGRNAGHAPELPSSSGRSIRASEYVLDVCGCRWER